MCILNHFIIRRKDEKKLQYSIYHHFIITGKDDEKLRCMYISSLYYNMEI